MTSTKHLDAYVDAFMKQEALEQSLVVVLDRLENARKDKDPNRITKERVVAEQIAKDLEVALDCAEQARLAYWRALFDKSVAKLEANILPLLSDAARYWRLSMRSTPFACSSVVDGLYQRIDDNLSGLDEHSVPAVPITSRVLDRADRDI